MKLQKVLLATAIACLSTFAMSSSNPYAYYKTSCGSTVVGYDQSQFEFYGQWWDYALSLNRHYCPLLGGIQILQIHCSLAPEPGMMSTYTLKSIVSVGTPW